MFSHLAIHRVRLCITQTKYKPDFRLTEDLDKFRDETSALVGKSIAKVTASRGMARRDPSTKPRRGRPSPAAEPVVSPDPF
ncbi:protein of unknown function [Candidatus Filomicrobium marinum]|uniref:Uncharacterized protein n=1 Tax=Candidatus Filomicrobium marinum TaxID=1608628 RepID=A0A0D6JES6_9HYPH|nr:protein of unknown function [Candidatus Filomicrobium marinum]CPR18338.1 protein of unknown function [Candidatus Filomicrobium marinum]